jgi:hypothetical protein
MANSDELKLAMTLQRLQEYNKIHKQEGFLEQVLDMNKHREKYRKEFGLSEQEYVLGLIKYIENGLSMMDTTIKLREKNKGKEELNKVLDMYRLRPKIKKQFEPTQSGGGGGGSSSAPTQKEERWSDEEEERRQREVAELGKRFLDKFAGGGGSS